MKLFKAMATVGGLTGLSRIAGFLRDILTALYLGAGPLADAFFVALKLPNFFRRITGEGAFSVAFVPVYSEALEREGPGKADLFASDAFTIMLGVLGVFTLAALAGMPWIIRLIAPGFIDEPGKFEMAVHLTRITFPYLLLISLSAVIGGMLNARDVFAPFAIAPVIFNLTLVGFLLLSDVLFSSAGIAMAWGVSVAGILQLVWLWSCARRRRLHIRIVRPKLDIHVRKVFRLMGPGLIGAGAMQINLFADMMIASLLPTGAISYLYYADRLNQLPLGIVGIAVGTALLPMLSRAISGGRESEARNLFNRGLEACLLLALPAAAGLAALSDEIIGTLFERGEFGPADTAATAMVLSGYAFGLPGYICAKVLSTACWARQDTAAPVKITILCAVNNIVLSLILIWGFGFGVEGIAIATGVSGWVQVALLWRVLRDTPVARPDTRLSRNAPRIIGASAAMGVLLYALSIPLHGFFEAQTAVRFAALAGFVGLALSVYFGAMIAMKILIPGEIRKFFRKTKPSAPG
ncbi:MAG: murein biosynthesis integral membrane protein MurJ [Rhodospirillales bacterium]|nr:murein biosynthesis integral membrane protein MurJ [Rhodospirillales bacterium]